MKRIVYSADMRMWEREIIHSGISSIELMKRAALGLRKAVLSVYGNQTVICLCGPGNNGGDGISLACLLKHDNIPVKIILLSKEQRYTPESLYYLNIAKELNVSITNEWIPDKGEILIDAIFGIGLKREITGFYADIIMQMNTSNAMIISADIPSGLDSDNGSIHGVAVKADITVTMQFPKPGLFLLKGPGYSGNIQICKLGNDNVISFQYDYLQQEKTDVQSVLPKRQFDSHKGTNGNALLCVGSSRYTGAALLCSRACLRAGCGILSVCLPDPVRIMFSSLPEAITIPTGSNEWDEKASSIAINAFHGKNAIGIGCGLGNGDASMLLKEALISKIPLVIDADGLNCISRNRELLMYLHENVIITPHPGEMARLLNCSISDVINNPLSAVSRFPCVVLLKGSTTLVSHGQRVYFCTEGSPALAKGGSGDVLTGIITALLAQGLKPIDAARAGTYLLGTKAKEAMSILNERMLLATDIIELLKQETYEKNN